MGGGELEGRWGNHWIWVLLWKQLGRRVEGLMLVKGMEDLSRSYVQGRVRGVGSEV